MSNSLAVMFPGLGADYPHMVARYLETHPQDAALVAHWSPPRMQSRLADRRHRVPDEQSLQRQSCHATLFTEATR